MWYFWGRGVGAAVAPVGAAAREGLLDETVLHHLQRGAFLTKAAPQIGHFRNGEAHVMGHHDGAGLENPEVRRREFRDGGKLQADPVARVGVVGGAEQHVRQARMRRECRHAVPVRRDAAIAVDV